MAGSTVTRQRIEGRSDNAIRRQVIRRANGVAADSIWSTHQD